MISDAHIHYNEALCKIWDKQEIPSIISCTTLQEYQEACTLKQRYPFLYISLGVHPWSADKISFSSLQESMDQVALVGEIGMDNVWCDVSLEQQKQVFEQQISYASKHQKPVILHTKGQEKTIASLIEKYPNTYLVHWYSCMDYVDQYQRCNCYFSIGPDIQDPALQQLVKQVELDHLLIETDGISAIAWAKHQPIEHINYIDALQEIAQYIAMEKQMDVENVWHQINTNLKNFVNGK